MKIAACSMQQQPLGRLEGVAGPLKPRGDLGLDAGVALQHLRGSVPGLRQRLLGLYLGRGRVRSTARSLGVGGGHLSGRQGRGRLGDQQVQENQQAQADCGQAAVHPGLGNQQSRFRGGGGGGGGRRRLLDAATDGGERVGLQDRVLGGQRHGDRRLIAGDGLWQLGGDEHLTGQRVGLLGERLAQRVGVGVHDPTLSGVGQRLQRRLGRSCLLQRDHVEQDLGVGHRLRDVVQLRVAGVGTVGEDQHRALTLRARHVDRRQNTVVQVSLRRELELFDHRSGLIAVLGGDHGSGDLAGEGHDADVDVVGDGVEEGQGGCLGGLEALAAHGLADVHRQDGGPLDLRRRGCE
jgi:hypothetical protein